METQFYWVLGVGYGLGTRKCRLGLGGGVIAFPDTQPKQICKKKVGTKSQFTENKCLNRKKLTKKFFDIFHPTPKKKKN